MAAAKLDPIDLRILDAIQRDGRITDITVVQSSGYQMLDFLAQRALMAVSPLPPLPQAYSNSTLTINLQFEYQR